MDNHDDKRPAIGDGDQRHQPKQSRSQQTYEAILRAAASLLAEQGFERTTTHQIAAQAGVSVGGLYRYFDGKQAILVELYSREITQLRKRVLEAFRPVDLVGQQIAQLVRMTVARAFEIYGERPALRRVLSEQARKIPELIELRRSQEAQLHQTVIHILGSVPGVRVPDIEAGAYLITLFIERLIEEQLLYRHGESLDDERVIDAASDFIVRYVMGRLE